MNDLDLFNLYNSTNLNRINHFGNSVESKLHVNLNENKVEGNYEWLTMMESTIQYLDNILRNPNRFIVNEEDVVKIELARRVTVESIKHLARNTNLIQDIDKKTGDVKPSKILNINKEESFNTYENRFIYTLIENMKMFVARKKNTIINESSYKSNKSFNYTGSCNMGGEKVSIDLNLNNVIDTHEKIVDNSGNDVTSRIEKVEQRIVDLTSTEVYKNLKRLHVSLVTSPIKKTNVILKNVNFQYAVNLWNYLQEHVNDDGNSETNNKDEYNDTGQLKKYFDESFLLDYLIASTLNKGGKSKVDKNKMSERLIGNIVEKIIDINEGISQEQLENLIARQYTIIKYRNVVTDKKIQKIYRESIEKYLKKVSSLLLESEENERKNIEVEEEQNV